MELVILAFIFLAIILLSATVASINYKLGAILRVLEQTQSVNVSTMEIASAALSTTNLALTALPDALVEMRVLGAAMSEASRAIDDAHIGRPDVFIGRN